MTRQHFSILFDEKYYNDKININDDSEDEAIIIKSNK